MVKLRLIFILILLSLPGIACQLFSPADDNAELTRIAGDVLATITAQAPVQETARAIPDTLPVPSGPIVVTLKPDGSGDYPNLETAVTALPAGSTVLLDPGIYILKGQLDIVNSLSLTGAGMDLTTIQGNNGALIDFDGPGDFNAEGITFQYGGTTKANVVEIKDGNIQIINCRFTDGVYDKTEDSGGAGLFTNGNTSGVVRDSISENNGLHGFNFHDNSHITLERNTCSNNAQSGIMFWAQSVGTASNNICTNNGHFGIEIRKDAAPNLLGNTAQANSKSGIAYYENGAGLAKENIVFENEWSGILLQNQAAPFLELNTIHSNKESGIVYFADAGGQAINNEIFDNEFHGIEIRDQALPSLEGNRIHDNLEYGINYAENSAGLARKNEIAAISDCIKVGENASPELVENTCSEGGSAMTEELPAGILFEDDFSDPESGWSTSTADGGEIKYENGELRIRDYTNPNTATLSKLERQFSDLTIEVESRSVDGSPDNWHGIYCRYVDSDNYYVGAYSADGYYTGLVKINGQKEEWAKDQSDAILQGLDARNAVRLECLGNQIRFYVNDTLLFNETDDQLSEGKIALDAESEDGEFSEVAYDNLVVRAPGPEGITPISPTAQTPVSDEPYIAPITLAEDVVDSQPVNPGTEFIYGVPKVCAVYDYQGMQPGTHTTVYWYHNGTEWYSEVITWKADEADGTTWDCIWNVESKPLDVGDWQFKMFLENKLVSDLTFKILP